MRSPRWHLSWVSKNRDEVDKAEREAFQAKGTAWVRAGCGICILYLMNRTKERERRSSRFGTRIR